MASSVVVVKLVWLAVVCVALGATSSKVQGAMTCSQVVSNLSPCVSYVMYGGNTVPPRCCDGVRSLYGIAQTTTDRRAVCNCIKNAVSSSGFTYSSFNLNNAAGIPNKCRVNIPYQISPNINCDSVQ